MTPEVALTDLDGALDVLGWRFIQGSRLRIARSATSGRLHLFGASSFEDQHPPRLEDRPEPRLRGDLESEEPAASDGTDLDALGTPRVTYLLPGDDDEQASRPHGFSPPRW